MPMDSQLVAFINAVGADIKAAKIERGDLTALPTTAKNSLVAALIEVRQLALDAAAGEGGAVIDDAGTGTDVAWSASKVAAELDAHISAFRSEIMGGTVDAALDTFAELQARLEDDQTLAASFSTALTKRVRFDAAQTLTQAEKLQACQNIGIGDPETDFVAAYNAAKA